MTHQHANSTKTIHTVVLFYLLAAPAALHADTLFVANANASNILAIPSGGGSSTIFASSLEAPTDVAFDANGILFDSDFGDGDIDSFSSGGTATHFATVAGAESLAFDASDDLYVDSADSNVITKITPQGSSSIFTQGQNLSTSTDLELAFDSSGNLYVVTGPQVIKIDPSGHQTVFLGGFIEATGIAFDPAGDIYVADSGAGEIYEYNSSKSLIGSSNQSVHDRLAYFQGALYFGDDKTIETMTSITATPTTYFSGGTNLLGMAFAPVVAPEPGSIGMVLLGAALIGLSRRRKSLRRK